MKIFITGGTSGLGFELASLYQKEGHRIAVAGINSKKFSFKENHSISPRTFPRKFPLVQIYEADVTQENEIKKAIHHFAKGDIDLVVACAGIGMGHTKRIPDFEHSKKVIEVNFIGVINTFSAATEIMSKNKKGHLVAISSAAAFAGYPQSGAYSGAKSGLNTFCESLSLDLAKEGMIVSTICPGFIETPLSDQNASPMPWMMKADKAALIIKKAIDKKKIFYVFPWQMKLMSFFMSRIPRCLFRFMMKKLFYPCD